MSLKSRGQAVGTVSATYVALPPGTSYFAVQNHDAANSVVITFGAGVATITPNPNGVVVKAGEYLEIKYKNLGGNVQAIAGSGAVQTTAVFG